MRRCTRLLLTVVFFLALALPVAADDGSGQLVFPGGKLVVGPGESVNNDVVVLGGTLEIRDDGRVRGDVVVLGGDASVNGLIDENLVVLLSTLQLGSTAVVDGNLVAAGSTVERAQGATIRGSVEDAFPWEGTGAPRPWTIDPPIQRQVSWGTNLARLMARFVQWIMTNLALIVLGVLMVLLLPDPTEVVQQAIAAGPFASVAVGLLTLFAAAIVLPVLVITCLGIPIAAVLAVAAAAAGVFGWTATCILLGKRLLEALRFSEPHFALEIAAGVVATSLLSVVPCIGWILVVLVLSIGLGSVVMTRFGTTPYIPSSTASPPTSPNPESS